MESMIENLASELETLINYRAREMVKKEESYIEKYEYLESMLLEMISEARALKEDMDKHDLKVSSIEAEGYLRFALSVESLIRE